MSNRSLIGVLTITMVIMAVYAFAENRLDGDIVLPPNAGTANPSVVETLFQGDLGSEMGIGCSNGAGTFGGPNDIAQGVTAVTPPPFPITSHWYEVFTQVSPNITALSFVAWLNSGGLPGFEFGREPGLNWALGTHTVVIVPTISAPSAAFFFGQNQPQSNVGMRWGLDTSSGSAMSAYIRAPSCGARAWTLLDNLGFPGNWVMSVSIPFGVPVELTSWGAVKSQF